uniref:Uncharacterized protein n=1 Tax=Anguilla anguilla TaxID=7936 RepID=A0A0E9TWD2_ANGAN
MTSTCVSSQPSPPRAPAPTATSNPTAPLCISFYQLNRTY